MGIFVCKIIDIYRDILPNIDKVRDIFLYSCEKKTNKTSKYEKVYAILRTVLWPGTVVNSNHLI